MGFKGRSVRPGSRAVTYRLDLCKTSRSFVEWRYFVTAGEEGSIVTHNGSVIPGKHKTKSR